MSKPVKPSLFTFPHLSNSQTSLLSIGSSKLTTLKFDKKLPKNIISVQHLTDSKQSDTHIGASDLKQNSSMKLTQQLLPFDHPIFIKSDQSIINYFDRVQRTQKQAYYGQEKSPYQNYKYPKVDLSHTKFDFLVNEKNTKISFLKKCHQLHSIEETMENIQLEKSIIEYGEKLCIKQPIEHGRQTAQQKRDILKKYENNEDSILNNKYLEMCVEWNNLLKMQKLQHVVQKIKKSHMSIDGSLNQDMQLGTMSSISKYRGFQSLSSKVIFLSKSQSEKKDSMMQQTSPMSTIPFQNNLFVRNLSRSDDSSSKKELDFVRDLVNDQSSVLESDKATLIADSSLISKDTFLMFFVSFWNLMRKEDAIVERLVWVLSSRDPHHPTISFERFQLFHKIFIFQESSVKIKMKFVLDFLMFKNEDEVSFMEIQGIITLLCQRVDLKIVSGGNNVEKQLISNQMLENIVDKIHRPQNIQLSVLKELIVEDKISSTTLLNLMFDR